MPLLFWVHMTLLNKMTNGVLVQVLGWWSHVSPVQVAIAWWIYPSHNSGTSVVFSLRFSHPESLAVGDSFFAMPWMATVGGRCLFVSHTRLIHHLTIWLWPNGMSCLLSTWWCAWSISSVYQAVKTFLFMWVQLVVYKLRNLFDCCSTGYHNWARAA